MNNALQAGQIDVWRLNLCLNEEDFKYYQSILDESEKKRAAAFLDNNDRSQWVAAHGQMRLILAMYTGITPSKIPLVQRHGEKPFIQDSKLFFNLSHTKNYALLALSNTGEIGIDIEYKREAAKIEAISRSTFSESEQSAILAVEGEERKTRFFRCWTKKEAFIKAIGKGFSYDTKSFSVPVESDGPSQVIQFSDKDYDTKDWTLLAFIPSADSQAALAFAFTLSLINFLEMSLELKSMDFGKRNNLPPEPSTATTVSFR